MKTWLSADHHVGHVNIIDFCDRPWRFDHYPYRPDVELMNEELVARWNSVVSPGDEVYYLGDFAMGKEENVQKYTRRLNGRKHLISGNHDRCWTGRDKGYRWLEYYLDAGWTSIQTEMVLEGYLLCHFPYAETQFDERYAEFRPLESDWGLPLIHGHVHEKWKLNGNQINVGVDVWDYTPVEFSTIKALLPRA
jgi:calcineurin-like phosphoesterase family protein